MIEYFSAHVLEETDFKPRRVKVTNRKTGNHYVRNFPVFHPDLSIEQQMVKFILATWTSPLTEPPRILWYDKSLSVLFFEVTSKGEANHGDRHPETKVAVRV